MSRQTLPKYFVANPVKSPFEVWTNSSLKLRSKIMRGQYGTVKTFTTRYSAEHYTDTQKKCLEDANLKSCRIYRHFLTNYFQVFANFPRPSDKYCRHPYQLYLETCRLRKQKPWKRPLKRRFLKAKKAILFYCRRPRPVSIFLKMNLTEAGSLQELLEN